ncbi:hypothetical protein LB504_009980 [Fusarium proliferatum]|nr:hypothetical protein LB504_009980 [Fusarium proliferatum]
MELHRNQRYHIAWILSSFVYHMIATHFFYKTFHRYNSTVRLHNVIAASIAHNRTPQGPIGDIIDSLLQEVPSIQASFLVRPNATVPQKGNLRDGNIVIRLRPDIQTGIIYFDRQETTKQKRLLMTGESRPLSRPVLMAINDLRSPNGRNNWLRHLKQDRPTRILPPTAYTEQGLKDLALTEHIKAGNGILYFKTAAADIKSRQFMVVSGISSYSGNKQQELPSNAVCKIVALYIACLVHFINPKKLTAKFPIASYFEYEAFDLDRPGFRLLRLEAGIGPTGATSSKRT